MTMPTLVQAVNNQPMLPFGNAYMEKEIMDILPELTLRELVNYGQPLIPASHCVHCAIPVDCTCHECAVCLGHSPTMQERIENDDPSWGDDWHEKHQVAERREVMLEGMV